MGCSRSLPRFTRNLGTRARSAIQDRPSLDVQVDAMISLKVVHGEPVVGRLIYRVEDYAFATEPRSVTSGASITINEIELMLDEERQPCVVFVEGYCPHPGWRTAVLRPPLAHVGLLRLLAERPITAGSVTAMQAKGDRWPTLVDRAAGWIRVGHGNPDDDHRGIQFAPGAVGVLEGDRLRALWLHPECLPDRGSDR